jgi:hypothetical protein
MDFPTRLNRCFVPSGNLTIFQDSANHTQRLNSNMDTIVINIFGIAYDHENIYARAYYGVFFGDDSIYNLGDYVYEKSTPRIAAVSSCKPLVF